MFVEANAHIKKAIIMCHRLFKVRALFLQVLTTLKIGKGVHQLSSVTQSCLTLCRPMDSSKPGFPVHNQLPEFT